MEPSKCTAVLSPITRPKKAEESTIEAVELST